MRETLRDYCIRTERNLLLEEWDQPRNGALTPEAIPYGSKKKVWWTCERGHSWQAAVYVRTSNAANCPYCAGRLPWPGENDLASLHPDIAAQWHPTKNGDLTPDQVRPGSHKLVWWRCDSGHEWQAQVKTRVSGCGCPVCANRALQPGQNDLAAQFPDIAAQWHPTKNGALTPQDVVPGAHRKVWWQCEKGHEWQAMIFSRTYEGSACPVCAGRQVVAGENDLQTIFPAIAAQWHPTKNGQLTAQALSPYSNRRVWWRCDLGHDFQAMVSARTRNSSGCPYCAGKKVLVGFNDLATRQPLVAAQWHPTLNGALTPQMVTAGSRRKVWWQCDLGHVWRAVVHSRTGRKKCGCPVCAGVAKPKRPFPAETVPLAKAEP